MRFAPRVLSLPLSTMALSLVLLAFAAGCPDADANDDAGTRDDAGVGDVDGGVSDVDAGTPLDIAGFCRAFHGAACDGFASCGCTLEGRAFTQEDCEDARTAPCEAALAEAAPLVQAGTLVVDPIASSACLAALAEIVDGCRVIDQSTLPIACAVFLLEGAALGAPCTALSLPTLCGSGAGVCAEGTCIALPTDGQQCLGGVLCGPGLACAEGTCGAPVAPAPRLDVGSPCIQSSQCDSGLACVNGTCSSGPARGAPCAGPTCAADDLCVRDYEARVCSARGGVGDACATTPGGACEDGLFCEGSTCAPLPVDGEACGANGECAAPSLCNFDSFLCVIPPGEDEPCLIGPALCAIGLGCNVDNVCVPGPGVGEACLIPNNLCADGLACDFTADGSFCAERRGAGGACQNQVTCQDGFWCGDSGTCEPALAVGTPCPSGAGCNVGDECSDLGGGFSCQPRPDTQGAVCYEDCGDVLACTGPGGSCAPALCASP